MSRRCCCGPCTIVEDDFNRVDNTDLGAKWVEVTGDSEIVSNQLEIPAGGRVVTVARNPFATPTGLVLATALDLQDGKRFRLLGHVTNDYSGYVYSELECQAAGAAVASIGTSAGEIVNTPTTYTAGENRDLSLCLNKTGMYALYGTSAPYVHACVNWNGGRRAGLMNAGSSTLEFDDFTFSQHYVKNPDCPICSCDCDHYAVCRTLKATFSTLPPGECLDGAVIYLYHSFSQSSGTQLVWVGTGTFPYCITCAGNEDWELRLNCAGPWLLCNVLPSCNYSGWPTACFPGVGKLPTTVSCNPLILEYGPFWVPPTIDPPHIGWEYFITVTNEFP